MFDNRYEKAWGIIFRDLIFGTLFMLAFMIIIVFPWISQKKQSSEEQIRIGDLHIELVWESKNNVDLDLIARGPDGETVFFRHGEGNILNLVRDDRGTLNDDTGFNFEHIISRSIPDGEYLVNVIVYSLAEGELPVEAKIVVTQKNQSLKLNASKILDEVKKEVSVLKFVVIDGKIVDHDDMPMQEELMPEMDFGDAP